MCLSIENTNKFSEYTLSLIHIYIITIEKLGVDAGEKVTFDQVLAVSGDDMKVGNPTVAGATVEASVIKEGRAKKVIVYKYKRKTGYHKKNGHRPVSYTHLSAITIIIPVLFLQDIRLERENLW